MPCGCVRTTGCDGSGRGPARRHVRPHRRWIRRPRRRRDASRHLPAAAPGPGLREVPGRRRERALRAAASPLVGRTTRGAQACGRHRRRTADGAWRCRFFDSQPDARRHDAAGRRRSRRRRGVARYRLPAERRSTGGGGGSGGSFDRRLGAAASSDDSRTTAARRARRLDRRSHGGSASSLDAVRLPADRRRRGLHGLHQARRRQRGAAGLRGSRLLPVGAGFLALGRTGAFGEHVAARQRDAALARQALDELARDDLLDGARGALQLDAVARFSSASTSWLLVLSSSATL